MERRYKVLFITTWYPTVKQPTDAVFVREHARAVQLYNDVVVINCVLRPFKELTQKYLIEKICDPQISQGIPTYQVSYRPTHPKFISYFTFIWSVFQAYRKLSIEGFHPEIIHANVYKAGEPAILLGQIMRLPVVITEHSSDFLRNKLTHLHLQLLKMTFNRAKLVMPVSSVLQKSIQERQIRACFQVLPNVVDTNLFFAEARTHNLHLAKRLLTIGPMDRSEKKGLPYLLQALQGLQQQRTDWHLDIIGDGDLRARYEQMTIELGIRQQVTFWGKQPKTEVAALMRQAQILIVPSLFETFSVVAAEALACGVPVLATRCGGPEEFVTDDVGVLVPPGDAAALQSGLQSMLANLHRYDPATISQQARARFSHASVGAQIHEVYRSVLN